MRAVERAADHYLNAKLCRARGVGQTLVVGDLTPQRAGSEVALLLADAGVRLRARQVQAEIAAMPAAEDVVGELERIASVGD